MAPTNDAFFIERTGLERVGVVRLDQDCWWAELEDAGSSGLLIYGFLSLMWHSPARRTRRKKGRRGLRPWPLRCLSQILSERKERMLQLLNIDVPFIDRMPMYL